MSGLTRATQASRPWGARACDFLKLERLEKTDELLFLGLVQFPEFSGTAVDLLMKFDSLGMDTPDVTSRQHEIAARTQQTCGTRALFPKFTACAFPLSPIDQDARRR